VLDHDLRPRLGDGIAHLRGIENVADDRLCAG
jgi:hypothetical protein